MLWQFWRDTSEYLKWLKSVEICLLRPKVPKSAYLRRIESGHLDLDGVLRKDQNTVDLPWIMDRSKCIWISESEHLFERFGIEVARFRHFCTIEVPYFLATEGDVPPTIPTWPTTENVATTRKSFLGTLPNARPQSVLGEHFFRKIKTKMEILSLKGCPQSDLMGVQNTILHPASVLTRYQVLRLAKHWIGRQKGPNHLATMTFHSFCPKSPLLCHPSRGSLDA